MDTEASFKLFDVRGYYPQQVDERLAFLIGKALANLRKPHKVLVASDTRESSPSLKKSLISGFSTGELQIFDLFESSVPLFYYTMATGDYDLGVIVTASHIGENQNGFKIVNSKGLSLDQAEILSLKKTVQKISNDQIVVPAVQIARLNNTTNYIEDLLSHVPKRNFASKIVIDLSKSSAVTPVLVAFSKLGINYSLVKSTCPGNPLLPEHRKDLERDVVKNKADLGIIWDSDGDRVVFVDCRGNLVPVQFVLGILAAYEVSRNRGKKVVCDVRAGLVVRDLVEKAGGELEVFPAWSQYIKYAMQEDPEICFGGEVSGHFVFRDFFLIDDGLLAALIFLSLWEDGGLEEKLQVLSKKYFELPEKNFPCDLGRAPAILESLTNYYRNKGFSVSIEDGLSVFGPDFKFNLRASLTEPLLRLNLETGSQKSSGQIIFELEELIEKHQ